MGQYLFFYGIIFFITHIQIKKNLVVAITPISYNLDPSVDTMTNWSLKYEKYKFNYWIYKKCDKLVLSLNLLDYFVIKL